MGFIDSAKGLSKKLKLDSHHAIERFGIFFTGLVTIGVLLITATGVSAFNNNREQLDSTALYISQFTTSRTQIEGGVPGVFVSPDRTRTMLLMQFRDPTQISTSADNYQAYLSGASSDLRDQALKSDVEAQIVVFGSTGYMAVVLDAKEAFPQQILNLTMRANAELVYSPGDPAIREDLRGQNSFLEYDQWRLYFNPGASQAQVVESMGGRTFDPAAVYYDLIISEREQETRSQLDEQLATMRAQLNRIGEYEDALGRTPTLDGDFLVNPRNPRPTEGLEMIANDQVVGDPGNTDAEGNITASTLELDTDWVAPNGFDFDWRSGSVREGYLDELVPSGQRYGQWLTDKAQAGTSASDVDRVRFSPGQIEWRLTDGSLLSDLGTTGMQDVIALQANLSAAYGDYWKAKETYQVTLPMELLEMEVELRGVEQSFSVKDDDETLFIY